MFPSPQDDFAAVMENVVGSRVAVICDGTNAHFRDFAANVVLALGTGVSTRNIAWFVMDQGLPEDQEVALLCSRQQRRFNNFWQLKKHNKYTYYSDRHMFPMHTIVHCVRQIRATYFTADLTLVHWSEEFITCEMLKRAWSEVLAWDADNQHGKGQGGLRLGRNAPNGRNGHKPGGGEPSPTASVLLPLLAWLQNNQQPDFADKYTKIGWHGGVAADTKNNARLNHIIENVAVSSADERTANPNHKARHGLGAGFVSAPQSPPKSRNPAPMMQADSYNGAVYNVMPSSSSQQVHLPHHQRPPHTKPTAASAAPQLWHLEIPQEFTPEDDLSPLVHSMHLDSPDELPVDSEWLVSDHQPNGLQMQSQGALLTGHTAVAMKTGPSGNSHHLGTPISSRSASFPSHASHAAGRPKAIPFSASAPWPQPADGSKALGQGRPAAADGLMGGALTLSSVLNQYVQTNHQPSDFDASLLGYFP